ncbi:superoxide dismutase [Desulfonema ishimotonii]|uniref:Superoxide dismutase n=1 Tax=Desulfonema ishimotonii TaxID=45657 RepID=A0A401FZA7_9BACT|nr:superoxide dismutase [Ni] [Desulfonema ishimotonii]GBC62287.1 superoxide dismutase [Desulfonema ishimotonii]
MRKVSVLPVILIVFALLTAGSALAHCEIPCGIYDDGLRVKLIYEHAGTIEKSMRQIQALSRETPVNYNQLIRWVSNKEAHADKIQHIVSQYFLTQRIKPDAKAYEKKLAVLHQLLVCAMKCKQTTDVENVDRLRALAKEFETLYFDHSHK